MTDKALSGSKSAAPWLLPNISWRKLAVAPLYLEPTIPLKPADPRAVALSRANDAQRQHDPLMLQGIRTTVL